MSLNHSLRNLRKNFPSCRWKYAKCLHHMPKTLKSQNTSLRMDRFVLNPFECGGLWNLARYSVIPAPEAAVLGLQHHGQFCGCRIGSFQHLAHGSHPKLHIFISLWRHTLPQSPCTCDLVKRKQVFAAVCLLLVKPTTGPLCICNTFHTAGAHSHKNNVKRAKIKLKSVAVWTCEPI